MELLQRAMNLLRIKMKTPGWTSWLLEEKDKVSPRPTEVLGDEQGRSVC